MDWIKEYYESISAVSSILTLGVWVFYAQLLYNGYVRQRRPRIIINRGVREGLEAMCLISNMSSEAIFVQYLIAALHCGGKTYSLELTEYKKASGDGDHFTSHQGPLLSGSYIHADSFQEILSRVQEHWQLEPRLLEDPETPVSLEIKVIAIYGSEDAPVGASRCFKINMNGTLGQQLIPETMDTARLNSRGQRRRVKRWIEEIEQEKAC